MNEATVVGRPESCPHCGTDANVFELVTYTTKILPEGHLVANYKFRCNSCGTEINSGAGRLRKNAGQVIGVRAVLV